MKAALDGASARALRPAGFQAHQLALVPMKDMVLGIVWAYCFVRRDVEWRGARITVERGTHIGLPALDDSQAAPSRNVASV